MDKSSRKALFETAIDIINTCKKFGLLNESVNVSRITYEQALNFVFNPTDKYLDARLLENFIDKTAKNCVLTIVANTLDSKKFLKENAQLVRESYNDPVQLLNLVGSYLIKRYQKNLSNNGAKVVNENTWGSIESGIKGATMQALDQIFKGAREQTADTFKNIGKKGAESILAKLPGFLSTAMKQEEPQKAAIKPKSGISIPLLLTGLGVSGIGLYLFRKLLQSGIEPNAAYAIAQHAGGYAPYPMVPTTV